MNYTEAFLLRILSICLNVSFRMKQDCRAMFPKGCFEISKNQENGISSNSLYRNLGRATMELKINLQKILYTLHIRWLQLPCSLSLPMIFVPLFQCLFTNLQIITDTVKYLQIHAVPSHSQCNKSHLTHSNKNPSKQINITIIPLAVSKKRTCTLSISRAISDFSLDSPIHPLSQDSP